MDKWNNIFNLKTVVFMKKISDESEDDESIKGFMDFMIQKVNYQIIVMLAMQWNQYEELKQIKIAERYVGETHLSRFLMLMDYLSYRYKKGELFISNG